MAVRNYGAASTSGEVVIAQAGSVVGRRTLDLPAGQEASVVFDAAGLEGVVVGRLELSDALAADNARFTIVAPATPLHVRLVGRNYWVEQAVAAYPDALIIDPDRDDDEREPDVVVCASCDDVVSADPRAGVLLVPPPAASPREPSAVIVTNSTHPLLRGLNADGAFVSPIGPGREPGPGVLAHAASLPVLVAHERDQRRIVELRIDLAASGITSEATFPLLIANAIEWLAEPRRRPTVLVAGEPLRQTLPDDAGDAVIITGPNGRVVPARRSGRELVASDTAVAGTYHVNSHDQDYEFVVNPAIQRESDLSDTRVTVAPMASPALRSGPYRAAISPGLLLAALALLALEWRHRTGKRGR
jgi:hypothetical protein